MEATQDICSQEEAFPLVGARFREQLGKWGGGAGQRDAQGTRVGT